MKFIRPAALALAAGVCLAAPAAARAQTPVEHIALGDRDFAARNGEGALRHYEAAIGTDSSNYEALWKSARSAVDLGEGTSGTAQTTLYRKAEALARRAVKVNANDAEGHFHLARSLGRAALSLGSSERVRYASAVHDQAREALRLDPRHPGAYHVMGMWNAEIMRLSGLKRMVARNFLGGRVFGEASWENAIRNMEQAIALDPNRIIHYRNAAAIYADRDMKDKARAAYQKVLSLPVAEYNDPKYKREAEAALRELR